MHFWHFLFWTAVLAVSGGLAYMGLSVPYEDFKSLRTKAAFRVVGIAGGVVFFATFCWLLVGMP